MVGCFQLVSANLPRAWIFSSTQVTMLAFPAARRPLVRHALLRVPEPAVGLPGRGGVRAEPLRLERAQVRP